MAGKKTTISPPAWFRLDRYEAAKTMDAADWYLNLSFRQSIASAKDENWRSRATLDHLRGGNPLIRRETTWSFEFTFPDDEVNLDFIELIHGREPRLGVHALRGDELYVFERMLPDAVRDFGRTFVPGVTSAKEAPPGFGGAIDHLFTPRMVGVFARIDLALPDAVLLDDMRDFIAGKRAEFAAIGGPQPYRDSLRELRGRRKAKLKTFAKLGLLPYLDLADWARETGTKVTDAAFADLIDVVADDFRETKKYAALLARPFLLRGWLLRAARDAVRKSSH